MVSMKLKGAQLFLPGVFLFSFLFARIGKRASRVMLLLALPISGALSSLISPQLPFNYIPTLLMVISGIAFSRPKTFIHLGNQTLFPRYALFLSLCTVGFLFLLLRWSTFGEGAKRLFPDLLTSPSGDRLSFTLIFPVLTLCLFVLGPLIAGLKAELNITTENAFTPFISGFFISALFAALQYYFNVSLFTRSGWIKRGFANGLASDFNGLGFVSGFAFFYALIILGQTTGDRRNKIFALLSLPLALSCAWWSQSRTALLLIVAALIWLCILRRRVIFIPSRRKGLLVLLLLSLVFLVANPSVRRMARQLMIPEPQQSWTSHIDRLSNGRLTMLFDGLDTVMRYPLSGIGPGNYLFYQRYKHHNEAFLHDLPLNQFLLLLLEGGLITLAVFLYWLWGWFRHSKPPWRALMIALCLSFLVGTPLWLPEGMALFWLTIALGEGKTPAEKTNPRRVFRLAAPLLIMLFFLSAAFSFRSLDPSRWQIEKNLLNSYGFWPADPGMEKVFHWTKGLSGYYVSGERSVLPHITCGAPLEQLPQKKQTVQLYWQGKLWQKMVFTENSSRTIPLPKGQKGWLELRVEPVFNLKEMGLGPETRTLGVQIHFQ